MTGADSGLDGVVMVVEGSRRGGVEVEVEGEGS